MSRQRADPPVDTGGRRLTASTVDGRRLRRLAKRHGIQTSYKDITGRRREATDDALFAVLRALGVPVESASDVRRALDGAEPDTGEPVRVAWGGKLSGFREGRIELEDFLALVKRLLG